MTRVSGTQYGSARSLVPLYDQALASERKPRRVNDQTAQVLRQYEQRAERQYGTVRAWPHGGASTGLCNRLTLAPVNAASEREQKHKQIIPKRQRQSECVR